MMLLDFASQGGFRKLAQARLSQCEYSLVFYLLSCLTSDVAELIATTKELAQNVGYSERTIKHSLEGLGHFQIIALRSFSESIIVKLQFDHTQWANLRTGPVRKFILGDASNLRSISPASEPDIGGFGSVPKLESYTRSAADAVVVEPEIRSFRLKSQKENQELRQAAENELAADKQGIRMHSEDELFLLQVILKHNDPRKQLYWALDASFRYPGLVFFFKNCRHLAVGPRKGKR